MTEIFVDADACPVKDEVVRVGERHGLVMHFVSNQWMRLDDSPLVKRVIVPDGPDMADDWIVEHIAGADVAITTDIPLAARCMEKAARVLGPTGKPFTEDSIGMALAMRELHQQLRDSGEMMGGNRGFTRQDRSRFLSALENMVQAAKRG